MLCWWVWLKDDEFKIHPKNFQNDRTLNGTFCVDKLWTDLTNLVDMYIKQLQTKDSQIEGQLLNEPTKAANSMLKESIVNDKDLVPEKKCSREETCLLVQIICLDGDAAFCHPKELPAYFWWRPFPLCWELSMMMLLHIQNQRRVVYVVGVCCPIRPEELPLIGPDIVPMYGACAFRHSGCATLIAATTFQCLA